MRLQTPVSISTPFPAITHQDTLLFMGSCFSENIGHYFRQYQFPGNINPFGIVFNPLSMARQLTFLLEQKQWTTEDLYLQGELWVSPEHHARFADTDSEAALSRIQEAQEIGAEMLRKSSYIFLTFGTAWAYCRKETGAVVANCHKTPAQYFEKKLLSLTELTDAYRLVLTQLFTVNPEVRIVVTVSPVRHLKDGAVENQWSKSILLLLVRELQLLFPDKVGYFPAYEIVMDELRDYRFYESDMLHPTATAIEYVWERLANTCFSEETRNLIEALEKIRMADDHRPFFTETIAYQQFQSKIEAQKKTLMQKYPFILF